MPAENCLDEVETCHVARFFGLDGLFAFEALSRVSQTANVLLDILEMGIVHSIVERDSQGVHAFPALDYVDAVQKDCVSLPCIHGGVKFRITGWLRQNQTESGVRVGIDIVLDLAACCDSS